MLYFFNNGLFDFTEWREAKLGEKIGFDVDTTTLWIKTSASLGTDNIIAVSFYTMNGKHAGRLVIGTTNPPTWYLSGCTHNEKEFYYFGSQWRITVKRSSNEIIVYLGNVEVISVNYMNNKDCDNQHASTIWSKDIAEIMFGFMNTATVSYIPHSKFFWA